MCFFKVKTQAITPNVMQSLPANAVAPTPEAPVFGAADDTSETATKDGISGKTGISSLKIKKDSSPVNIAGANLQIGTTTGLKVM